MKRAMSIVGLILVGAVFVCTDAIAGKTPKAPQKVVQLRPESGNRWLFEGRLVTMPNIADVNRDLRVAEMGDASAQFRMGLRYDQGSGVRQDHAKAVKWLKMAADQGLPEAQYNLGCMYINGLGVPEDSTEALAWFYKAALQGNTSAQKNLGAMYGKGQGVTQNHAEAYAWSSIAVMSGNEDAAINRDVAASQLSAEELQAAHERAVELYGEVQRQAKPVS
jgi:TPR repeat protein